jgi:hypothetical protein
MLNLVTALTPGKPAKLLIRRQQKDMEILVDVGRRPAAERRP